MAAFHLRCTECGAGLGEDPGLLVCPACSALQEPGLPIRGVLEVVLEEIPDRWPSADPSSPRFLRAFLPLSPEGPLPPLSVGGTPLLPAPRLRKALGTPRLWLKDDTRNPSGSTKDRASLLVVAKAMEYGRSIVATASTGNAATALNPFTVEGKKTAALEIAAALAPDAASVADSLTVGAPRNAILCLRRIRQSGGGAVAVPDPAILEAVPFLARHTGVLAEPAAAASLAGLRTAVEDGLVEKGERIVLLVTGHGLKDMPAMSRGVEQPAPIDPDLEAVAARLGIR